MILLKGFWALTPKTLKLVSDPNNPKSFFREVACRAIIKGFAYCLAM